MIEFLNEQVRGEFHLLPLERQKEFRSLGESLMYRDQVLVVLHVDRLNGDESEVTIRILKKGDKPVR